MDQSRYKWLTNPDDPSPEMARVTEVEEAREPRDELCSWLMNQTTTRGSGTPYSQLFKDETINRLTAAMGKLDQDQQKLWADALNDKAW